MLQSIRKRLLALPSGNYEMIKLFDHLHHNQMLTSASLTGGASATVTTGAAVSAMVGGLLIAVATGASLAALNGPTIANSGSTWQVWYFTVDAAGTFYTYPGVPASTLASVQLPIIPETPTQIFVGSLIINNASVGSFVPATTLLNVTNLNVIFSNMVGPFHPAQSL